MKRVKVDFSTTVRGGMVRASQSRAVPSPLQPGDRVEAFDPDEDLSFAGVVVDIDDDGRFAYLQMEWEPRSPKAVPVNRPGSNFVLRLDGDIALVSAATTQSVPVPPMTITPVADVVQYAQSA